MVRLCGARNRNGGQCQRVACKNGRCMNHGGKSTGPKNVSESGRLAQKMGSWKHGRYSKETIEENRMLRDFMRSSDSFLRQIW